MLRPYQSPRWSGEIFDCSMPMTFDTYSQCSYNCLYCFAFNQKSVGATKKYYGRREVGAVSVEGVKKLFRLQSTAKTDRQFHWYIKNRYTMQWGGMSDPLDGYEKRYGRTLDLIQFFRSIRYPICFSTKGTWWTQDDRYVGAIYKADHFNFKFSIINLDPAIARKVEMGVDSPSARLEAMRRVSKLGVDGVTLRLRPFIIGLSDRNDEHLELIRRAKDAGATAVSTEFFCLELRANAKRWDRLNEILGYDIKDFYRRNSKGSGYLRLNRAIKEKVFRRMKELCDKIGMRFYVSDAHFKEMCPNASCCGLATLGKCSKYWQGNFLYALLLAKKKGRVQFKDISADKEGLKNIPMYGAVWFNTGSTRFRVIHKDQTMYDYMREVWNTPNHSDSPYKYFEGVMVPVGVDENEDVIYEYKGSDDGKAVERPS